MARTLREEVYADAGLVDDPLIDRYYNAAHQPGARYAISSFLKGDLNIPIQDEFKRLKQPILLVWGAESTYTPLSQARAFQEANSTAILHVLQDSRQVPHDEKADEFNKLALSWLQPLTADQELRIL
jgi:pimeloyl-ACP methyl ester carboxylesterase